ncbi:hypothetical protein CEXT_72751 [Caerostris extrusa]|uniref:Uncharacterized protein n=1 Tax=Caerostris extrusa TaxID=172846 RepID=A0AAV4TRQ5_CAEEX|nr:hypothetical protein CEXT_72751 [Caerostris extrusa]
MRKKNFQRTDWNRELAQPLPMIPRYRWGRLHSFRRFILYPWKRTFPKFRTTPIIPPLVPNALPLAELKLDPYVSQRIKCDFATLDASEKVTLAGNKSVPSKGVTLFQNAVLHGKAGGGKQRSPLSVLRQRSHSVLTASHMGGFNDSLCESQGELKVAK